MAYCGPCGHQMTVQYRGGAKYICNYLHQNRRLSVCRRVGAGRVDAAVVAAFWQTLTPAERALEAEAEQLRKACAQQLQRWRYQATLTERQYQACDPDNRLVASELERRWEQSLRAMRDAEDQHAREAATDPAAARLTPALRSAWKQVGAQLPQLWRDGRLANSQKKRLLRALIEKVVSKPLAAGSLSARIVWKGGVNTCAEVALRVAATASLPTAKQLVDSILALAQSGVSDEGIAYTLSTQGHRSAYLDYVPIASVARCRHRHGIRRPATWLERAPAGSLTLSQVARRTGIKSEEMLKWILQGSLRLPVEEATKRFLVPNRKEALRDLHRLAKGEIDTLH